MSFYNYYKILGVSINASQDQIKAAFRELAVKYHPDKNPGNAQAEEVFKLISNAYEVLGDPRKKADYDLRFTLILAAIQQKLQSEPKHDRRKYGISKRIFKSKDQEVAEQIAAYEIKIRNFSFYQRVLVHSVLAFLSWLLAFSNWFATIKETEYAGIILGVMGFAVSIGFLFSDFYGELNYRYIRNVINYDFEKRISWFLPITVLSGIFLLFPLGEWRFQYHLKHYPVYTIGNVEEVHQYTVEFTYETPEGTIYKVQDLDTDFQNFLINTADIKVVYSSQNPHIGQAILTKVQE